MAGKEDLKLLGSSSPMAGKEYLKLLGLPVSPFAIRAQMVLNIKGLSYEYIEQDFFNKSQLLRISNPVYKKVPVLIHNARPICESLIIVEYVDQTFVTATPPILLAHPYERAIVKFWAAYIDNKMFPNWMGIIKATTLDAKLEMVKQSYAKMKHMEDIFTSWSNGKDFFGGDSIGYLDLTLGSFLFLFKTIHNMFGVDIINADNTPLLAMWARRFMETKTSKDVAPDENRIEEHVKKAYRGAASSAL
ncbi:hypothetical protein EJB05_26441, partial [Eragrostis curvula]